MSKKVVANITLTGCLSLSVGRFRFFKGRTVQYSDPDVLAYCKGNPNFEYHEIEQEVKKSPANTQVQKPAPVIPAPVTPVVVETPVDVKPSPENEVKPEPVVTENKKEEQVNPQVEVGVTDDDLALDLNLAETKVTPGLMRKQ